MVSMNFTPDDMLSLLPFFIDSEFPKHPKLYKGRSKRGEAIVTCALFIQWLKDNVKKSK